MRKAALALALPALLAAGCRKARVDSLDQPRQTIEDFTLKQSYHAKPSWELYSPLAHLSEESQRADLESPKLRFFKEGRLTSILTSQKGVVGMKNYEVTLSCRVVATALEDGSVLNTEELKYSNARGKFFTDKDVLVKKPEGVLRGQGLEANSDLSEIRIFKQRSILTKEPGT